MASSLCDPSVGRFHTRGWEIMSLSNYEVQVMLGCLECEFSDKEKLEQMKQFHDRKDWINCSKVKGSCLFPFRRNMMRITIRLDHRGNHPMPTTRTHSITEAMICLESEAHKNRRLSDESSE